MRPGIQVPRRRSGRPRVGPDPRHQRFASGGERGTAQRAVLGQVRVRARARTRSALVVAARVHAWTQMTERGRDPSNGIGLPPASFSRRSGRQNWSCRRRRRSCRGSRTAPSTGRCPGSPRRNPCNSRGEVAGEQADRAHVILVPMRSSLVLTLRIGRRQGDGDGCPVPRRAGGILGRGERASIRYHSLPTAPDVTGRAPAPCLVQPAARPPHIACARASTAAASTAAAAPGTGRRHRSRRSGRRRAPR